MTKGVIRKTPCLARCRPDWISCGITSASCIARGRGLKNTTADLAEGQVDAGPHWAPGFRYLVNPVVLKGARHDQQGIVGQLQAQGVAPTTAGLQLESAGRAQGYRGDDGVRAQLFFIVRMPGHAILAVAIQVAEHAGEVLAREFLQPLADTCQLRGPGQGLQANAGIAISGARVAIPGLQAGNGKDPALDANLLLTPLQAEGQLLEQAVGLSG